MANPVFNAQTMQRDADGWAAPTRGTHTGVTPVTDGPAEVVLGDRRSAGRGQ